MGDKLARKEESFARQYVILHSNGTAAAISAGYARNSADVTASKLLGKPKVKARVKALLAEQEKKHNFSAERVLQELAKLAFSDARALFDSSGKLKSMEEWPPDAAAAVQAVETSASGHAKHVKLASKTRALEIFCKYYKMFAEDRTVEDLGVKVIVLDMPRPIRNVTPAALPPANGHNGNGHKPHNE